MSRQDAGKKARVKLGWWHGYRFLLLRRLTQFSVLLLFLLGPVFGIWLAQDNDRNTAILRGNYSSSLLLDTIPFTDPLILLQSLFSGYLPQLTAIIGAVIIFTFYALVARRLYCAWVCPLNVLTDVSAWLRRKLRITSHINLSRNLRFYILFGIFLGSALSGVLVWEFVNPIALLGRGLINGLSLGASPASELIRGLIAAFGMGIWLLVSIVIFDLFFVEHGWCSHLCPLGALYDAVGKKALFTLSAKYRNKCDHCMDCIHVCPSPKVLREPLFNKQSSPCILSDGCISCGRCIDVCSEKVFVIQSRFIEAEVKDEKET